MLKISPAIFVVCLLALPSLSQAAMEAGTIKAFRVSGDVQLLDESTGASSPLEEGQTFSQGYTVTTAVDSSVVLLFSNGSSIILNADTILSVAKFLQEPYDPGLGDYSELDADPSQSDTLLKMDYGDIIGNVKRLRSLSLYLIETPVGTAGIRGTTFRIRVQRITDPTTGLVTERLIITNAEGTVEFARIDTGGAFASVPEGTAFTVEATIDANTGQLTITLVDTANIPDEIINEIKATVQRTDDQAVQTIKQEIKEVIRSTEDTKTEIRDNTDASTIVRPITFNIQLFSQGISTDMKEIVRRDKNDPIFRFLDSDTEIIITANIDANGKFSNITLVQPSNLTVVQRDIIFDIFNEEINLSQINFTTRTSIDVLIISIEGGGLDTVQ